MALIYSYIEAVRFTEQTTDQCFFSFLSFLPSLCHFLFDAVPLLCIFPLFSVL